MKNIDNPDEELSEISPFLLNLKQAARQNSDDTPKNYFADFEQKMMQKISKTETKPLYKLTLFSRFRPFVWFVSVAASLLAVAAVFTIFYEKTNFDNSQLTNYEQLKQNISKEDVAQYLLERPQDLDLNWLADAENLGKLQLSAAEISVLQMDTLLQNELLNEMEESDFYE